MTFTDGGTEKVPVLGKVFFLNDDGKTIDTYSPGRQIDR